MKTGGLVSRVWGLGALLGLTLLCAFCPQVNGVVPSPARWGSSGGQKKRVAGGPALKMPIQMKFEKTEAVTHGYEFCQRGGCFQDLAS